MNRSMLSIAALVALLIAPSVRAADHAMMPIGAPAAALTGPVFAPSFGEMFGAQTLPAAAIPGAQLSAARPEAAAPEAAMTAIEAMGAELMPSAAQGQGGDAAPSGVLTQTFDGAPKLSAGSFDPAGGGAGDGGNGGNGGNGNVGGPSGPSGPDDGGRLNKAYPRVVVILDTFHGPASDSTVSYIEKLADLGVHVAFVTPRAEKGPNSAETVLTSKLRTRAGNPVMVVSYNGARVSMHRATRAENPKGAIGDSEGFPQPTLELFAAINAAAKQKFNLKSLTEVRSGVQDHTYLYGAELQTPKSLSKAKRAELVAAVTRFYNDKAQAAGLAYRFEASETPEGKILFQTQSTALRLNTGRLYKAIAEQYPDVRDRLKPEDVMFFADSSRAARFLSTLQTGHFIHGTSNEAELKEGLFAVLHGRGLETVKVTRNQLRSYVSWLEARQRYGSPRGGGGFRLEPSAGRYQQEAKFYLAILHYHLMGELYHRMRNHSFRGDGLKTGSDLQSALILLDEMAKNPKAYGINLDEDLQHMRATKRWKPFERDRMGVIRQWLANYYDRNFPNFPNGVSQRVVGTMINLHRDSGTNIKLYYESPMTKRQYEVGVLPARGEVVKDDKGYVLVVHAYRTGKEMRQDDFEESLEVNLAMRAMLQGYAKREEDGRWTVNGEPARVMAVYHTMTRDVPSHVLTADQVQARSGEVTALIEKMLADKEFMAYWEAEQAKNQNVAVGRALKDAKKLANPKAGKNKKKGKKA